MSARAQSAPQRGVRDTSEPRGRNRKSPSERLTNFQPRSSSTQRNPSVQSNGTRARVSQPSNSDSVRRMRAATSESAILRRQSSSSRLRTPSSDRYKSEERLKSDKARAKTAELVYLRQTNPRPTPSRRRPRTGDTPLKAVSSDAAGLNFSSPAVPPPRMKSLSAVKVSEDDAEHATVSDLGHESPTTIAGLGSTTNTFPSAAGSSEEGEGGQIQLLSDGSETQHLNNSALQMHPGTLAVADKVAARKLGMTSPKTSMDGKRDEDSQPLPPTTAVPMPMTPSESEPPLRRLETPSTPVSQPQRSHSPQLVPPPPPLPTSSLIQALDAPLTPHLPPDSFMSPVGHGNDRSSNQREGGNTSRRGASGSRNASSSRNSSKEPRPCPSSALRRSASESRLLFSPPTPSSSSSSSALELAAQATEPRAVFFPGSLSLDPLDTVAEAKAEIQRLYGSELTRLKWTVTGFKLYRCVGHGDSAGAAAGAGAATAVAEAAAAEGGGEEFFGSTFGKRKSQSVSGPPKTPAPASGGGTGAACYYSTSSEALSNRVVISQLPGFLALPMFALKAPLPEAIRERVGGGFQIKARDPVSHTLLGMDRYLKRYPPEVRYLDVRILPLRAAATTLAAAERGRAARRRANALRLIQRTIAAQKEARRAKVEFDAAVALQGMVRLRLARHLLAARRARHRRTVVALLVQPLVRGRRVRRRFAVERAQLAAAVQLQCCARMWLSRRRLATARRVAEAEEAARLVREMKQLEVARSKEEALLVSERFRERAGRGLSEQEARAQALAIGRIVRDEALSPRDRLEVACVRAFRVPPWRGVAPDVLLSSELLYHECPALQGMPLVPWQVILDAAALKFSAAAAAVAPTPATTAAEEPSVKPAAAAPASVQPAGVIGSETKSDGSNKRRGLSGSRSSSRSNLVSSAPPPSAEVKLNDVPCARCANTTAAFVAPYGLWQHVRCARPHRSRLEKSRRSRSSQLEPSGSKSSSGSFNKGSRSSEGSSASKKSSKVSTERAEVSAGSKKPGLGNTGADSALCMVSEGGAGSGTSTAAAVAVAGSGKSTAAAAVAVAGSGISAAAAAVAGGAELATEARTVELQSTAAGAAPVGVALGLCHSCARVGHGVLASAAKRTLTFNRAIKFGGRSAVVHSSSSPTLALLARMLTDNPLPIQVEGHTNNDASLDHVPFLKAAQQGQKPVAKAKRSTSTSTSSTSCKSIGTSGDSSFGEDCKDVEDDEDFDNDVIDANGDVASRDMIATTPYHLSQLRADAVCRDLLRAADVYLDANSQDEVASKDHVPLSPSRPLPSSHEPGHSEHNQKSRKNNEEASVDLASFLFPIGVGGQRLKARAKSAKLTEPQAQRNRRVEVHFLDLA